MIILSLYMNNNFVPISTNSFNHSNFTKFNNAFNVNSPLIHKIDHSNNDMLLHNNVGSNVLGENVVEYKIIIDSLDRDIKIYPDPFSFIVKFGQSGNNIMKSKSNRDGIKMAPPPTPYINREFKNVLFIKLETVILPHNCNVVFENDCYVHSNSLLDDRYVNLIIDNLEPNTIFTTSDNSSREDPFTGKIIVPPTPFAIILPDKLISRYHYSGTPYYGSKSFRASQLGNISQLNIKFTTSQGFPLKFNNLYSYNDLLIAENAGKAIPLTDIRHPLNIKNQISMSFIIGVVECQIQTNTKFEL